MSNVIFTYNKEAALTARQGGFINESGAYVITFTEAALTVAPSGAKAIELSDESDDGRKVQYLSVYVTKKDGTENKIGVNMIHAIMGCAGVIQLTQHMKAAGQYIAPELTGICDNKLCVVQGKTKTMVRISLDNQIEALGISLREVLAEIKKIHGNSEFLLAGKSGKALSKAFREAREKTGLTWENPPPFHELRSLSGRLYAKQKGKDFAQDILGHKSASMTEKYTDGRGKEWKDV